MTVSTATATAQPHDAFAVWEELTLAGVDPERAATMVAVSEPQPRPGPLAWDEVAWWSKQLGRPLDAV